MASNGVVPQTRQPLYLLSRQSQTQQTHAASIARLTRTSIVELTMFRRLVEIGDHGDVFSQPEVVAKASDG